MRGKLVVHVVSTPPRHHVPLNMQYSGWNVLDVIGGYKLCIAAGHEDTSWNIPEYLLQ